MNPSSSNYCMFIFSPTMIGWKPLFISSLMLIRFLSSVIHLTIVPDIIASTHWCKHFSFYLIAHCCLLLLWPLFLFSLHRTLLLAFIVATIYLFIMSFTADDTPPPNSKQEGHGLPQQPACCRIPPTPTTVFPLSPHYTYTLVPLPIITIFSTTQLITSLSTIIICYLFLHFFFFPDWTAIITICCTHIYHKPTLQPRDCNHYGVSRNASRVKSSPCRVLLKRCV